MASVNISPPAVNNGEGASNAEPVQASSPQEEGDGSQSPLRRMTYGRSGGSAVVSPNSKSRKRYQLSFCGPKMHHLKKRDGEALWRKDIQYDFLHALFTDTTQAFTNPRDPQQKCTFADIYLDAMARSSKCSKILAEKLLGDRQAGIKIAMVCLLVNSGRMNTTLNFFPEMRTQLRTYHPIPSLQTHDTQDYKQLQDAPRLKSILKGACEGIDEATTMDTLKSVQKIPRVNPISLVFLMSSWAYEVKRDMFPNLRDVSFFDLIVDTSKTSQSRARAFLWLVWTYMESENIGPSPKNPFGANFPVPEPVDPNNFHKENVDPPEEIVFGNKMTLQRLAILHNYGASENTKEEANQGEATNNQKSDKQTEPSNEPQPVQPLQEQQQQQQPAQDQEQQKQQQQQQSHSHTHHATPSIPLVMPKKRMRSVKDRRINDQFWQLLKYKRRFRTIHRQERANAAMDLWRRIEDIDPLYDSDDDIAQARANGRSHGLRAGAKALGLGGPHVDYGEECASFASSLRYAAAKLRKAANEIRESKKSA